MPGGISAPILQERWKSEGDVKVWVPRATDYWIKFLTTAVLTGNSTASCTPCFQMTRGNERTVIASYVFCVQIISQTDGP